MTRPANQAWGWLLGLALAGALQLLLAQHFVMVALHHVAQLMRQHRGDLGIVLQQLVEAAGDQDVAAGRGEGVDFAVVDHPEGPRQFRAAAAGRQPAPDQVHPLLRGRVLEQRDGAEDAPCDHRPQFQFLLYDFLLRLADQLAAGGEHATEGGPHVRGQLAGYPEAFARFRLRCPRLALLAGLGRARLVFDGVGHQGGLPPALAGGFLGSFRGGPVRLHLLQAFGVEARRLQRAFVDAAHAGGFGDPALAGLAGEQRLADPAALLAGVGHAHVVHAHVAALAACQRQLEPQALLPGHLHRRGLLEGGDLR